MMGFISQNTFRYSDMVGLNKAFGNCELYLVEQNEALGHGELYLVEHNKDSDIISDGLRFCIAQ